MLAHLAKAMAIGAGATLLMDAWNFFLKRVFGIASLDYCLLGRWVSHLPRGTMRHDNISAAQPQPLECATGWVAHYTIGISLAVGFGLLMPGWLGRPALLPAILYGLATIVFPFLILQPALGLGIASSRAAHPARARIKSLATHLVFGLGLWLAALALNAT